MTKAKKLLLILFVPIAFFVYAIYTISDYGVSWDEPYHFRRGQAFLHFFLTGKKTYEGLPKYPPLKGDSDSGDFRNSQQMFEAVQKNPGLSDPNFRRSFYQDNAFDGEYHIGVEKPYGHPALNGILAALSNYIFYHKLGILGDLESYQLFIILTVSLTTFAIAIFIWKHFGIVESIISSFAFASYPLIISHQHFNIKDPVVTSFYTLFILSAFQGITKNKFSWLLVASFFFGLGLATKFNIIFAILPIFIWFVVKIRHFSKPLVIASLFGPFIVLGIFLVSFPTIWQNPIDGLWAVVRYYLEVGYPKEGSQISSLFSSYPIRWVIFTTPPVLLVLVIISFANIKKLSKKDGFGLLLILWLAVTIGRNSFFGALNYGGARLFMEYVPALAMLAGLGARLLVSSIKYQVSGPVFWVLTNSYLVILFAFLVYPIAKYHPHEGVYFNFIIGGLAGAREKNFPSWGDSYGNAYYTAILWLNENAERNAQLSLPVANSSNIPRFKLRPDIAFSPKYWSGLNHNGEYLIELTYDYAPMNWFALKYLNEAMTPVYEVKVDGISIAKVWKNDKSFVKSEYQKLETIEFPAIPNQNLLTVKLPSTKKITQVSVSHPIKSCSPIKSGYIRTSIDDKNWTREPEDIARDQLNRAALTGITQTFNFYFVARPAKTIVIETTNADACILSATEASVTFLREN